MICGPVIGRNRRRKTFVQGLVSTVANVLEPAVAITLLRFHLLVNEPESVDEARNKAKGRQTDADEEVTAASRDKCSSSWREYNSNDDEKDVGGFDSH